LLVRAPGVAAGTRNALTTNVDIHATLCDIFGVDPSHRVHGRSLAPLLDETKTSIRDWALSGIWGREVHLITDHTKYVRAPTGANEPLSMWSNRWSTMPLHAHPDLKLPLPDDRAVLDHMPGSTVPVIRQPFMASDFLPFWAYSDFAAGTLAYDLAEDPAEDHDRAGEQLGTRLGGLLHDALIEMEAPDDQLVRLGY